MSDHRDDDREVHDTRSENSVTEIHNRRGGAAALGGRGRRGAVRMPPGGESADYGWDEGDIRPGRLLWKRYATLKKAKQQANKRNASVLEENLLQEELTHARNQLDNIIDEIVTQKVLILNSVDEAKTLSQLITEGYFAEEKRACLEIVRIGSVPGSDAKRKMWQILESNTKLQVREETTSVEFEFP